MIHTNEISQFSVETQLLCVCFVPHRRIGPIVFIKCGDIRFYVGGCYKLRTQCKSNSKLIFHVVIPHTHQHPRKIMKT